jgi:hypothetical protein
MRASTTTDSIWLPATVLLVVIVAWLIPTLLAGGGAGRIFDRWRRHDDGRRGMHLAVFNRLYGLKRHSDLAMTGFRLPPPNDEGRHQRALSRREKSVGRPWQCS